MDWERDDKSLIEKTTGIKSGTLAELGKNQRVNLDILERICKELQCDFGDTIDDKGEKER